MTPRLTTRETGFVAVVSALLLLALLAPAVAQPANYHAFADRRSLAGIPFAMDVLTNLAFAACGAAGLWVLRGRRAAECSAARTGGARLFFCGLIATALGSSWYHANPGDSGLLVDRLCMALAFSGLLSMIAVERLGERAGRAVAWGAPLLGFASAAAWSMSGNVVPWAVFQFGGMLLLLAGAALSTVSSEAPVRWPAVILIYAAAKVLELADHAVFDLTQGLISGHSLKHVVAAFAAWPVLQAARIAGTVAPDAAPGSRPALAR